MDGSTPRQRRAPGSTRTALTPALVVDAALELTRAHGLDGWTIRDLATALGVWPNTIAYHVGDREAIVTAVTDRVVAMMPNPPADLDWQGWFRALLYPGRDIIAAYPGVARRLSRDGATVPAALPIMDRGIGLLAAAGFGERAPLAYAALLNSAVLLISLDDDRNQAGRAPDTPATTLLSMTPPPQAGAGWDAMQPWLTQWAAHPADSRQALYRYTIETILTGLATDLGNSLAARRDGSAGPTPA